MYVPPRNDATYSLWRLNTILGRRRLRFNPYTVSDERLMEIVGSVGWGNEFDIVQLTSVSFTRLRETADWRGFDGIYMRTPTNDEEIFIPRGIFTRPLTACDTLRQVRSWMGKSPIRNEKDIIKLVGKRFFVSRTIRGINNHGSFKPAYRFHRIKGNMAKDAAMIREAICAAKIEMLERVLESHHYYGYLDCRKGLIEYEILIRQAIDQIRHYPGIPDPNHNG